MGSMKLEDAWTLYEMAVLDSSKKKSQATETGRWRNYVAPKLGEKSIDNLTNLDLLMLPRDLEGRGLSPQTIHHCLSLLRRILRKAVEWGSFRSDASLPSFKRIMPKFDNKRQRFLDDEQLSVLLDALKAEEKSLNWHDIALFAVSTGLRKGEIFNLRLCDVNFNARIVTIMDTKSGRNRTIQLNDVAFGLVLKKSRSHQRA